MVVPSTILFRKFWNKASSDFTIKKSIFNVWCNKNQTKSSSKTLLRLVRFLLHQTLEHFCSKIAKIVRCYCHDLGQSERNIFDFSLCVRGLHVYNSDTLDTFALDYIENLSVHTDQILFEGRAFKMGLILKAIFGLAIVQGKCVLIQNSPHTV